MEDSFTIKIQNSGFQVLDQLLLPTKVEYIEVKNIKDAFQVIRDMNVRGAPLIAVVATQALKFEFQRQKFGSYDETRKYITESIDYLRQSRPTAVNLFNDTQKILDLLQNQSDFENNFAQKVDSQFYEYQQAYIKMSQYAAESLLKDCGDKKLNVLTICNTGKLATGGDGTALGVVRQLQRLGKLNMLYIPETRLTAYEAQVDQIPSTLITDNMCGFLMQQQKIDCVVVGADRVAKNGDTANKIGTYSEAVLAKYHNLPFYVILPDSSIDFNIESGSQIKIEERKKEELIYLNGFQLAPLGLNTYNPAFDITPGNLITRIFTEKGEFKFK